MGLSEPEIHLKALYPNQEIPEELCARLEHPILDRSFVVGFADIYSTRYHIGIEIKSEIVSIGDLIRQIQFYRNYTEGTDWVVISPDERFAGLLKDQGILFYRYPAPGELL
jgi:hypothetical protein